MKKIALALLIFPAIFMMACNMQNMHAEDKVSVVCTAFPAYDWTCSLLEGISEEVTVEYLFDDGADVHSFQPGADDYVKIAESDIFIYFGGTGTDWIEEALANSEKEDRIVIDLCQANDVKLLENTTESHRHKDDDEHTEHEHDESSGFDEHIWMSVSNAQACVYEIKSALCRKLPDKRKEISQNCSAYIAELEGLDEKYQNSLSYYSSHYILVADRFPFRYLAEEYDISYDAAFAGCQTEAEADFDMIIELASCVERYRLSAIIVTEVSDQKLAETVWENVKDREGAIMVMDSMQAVTASDIRDGISYITVMENNLDVLAKAFPY